MRRHLILLGGLAAALALGGAADASWAISGSGYGSSKAASIPPVAAPSHALPTWPGVVLTWGAVDVGGGSASYTVRRYAEGGALQAVGAGCSGSLATNGCTESTVPIGRWQYSVQATRASWAGAESTKSSTVEIAAPPSSLVCTNCPVYAGTTYINSRIRTSVKFQAVLPATSLTSDTANLSVTDSASNTVSKTKGVAGGAETISFANANTNTFADGTVTASTYVSANTGDHSPTTSITLLRDTAAPTAVDIAATNGAGSAALKVDDGDHLTYAFSEPFVSDSILSGWDGSPVTVSAVVANSASNDRVTVAGVNLGSVNTQANYVSAALTCGSSTMTATDSTVTVTLGGCAPGSSQVTGVASSVFKWTPSGNATDLAGNGMSTAVLTGGASGF